MYLWVLTHKAMKVPVLLMKINNFLETMKILNHNSINLTYFIKIINFALSSIFGSILVSKTMDILYKLANTLP
ncbi:hypothetical protein BpHYR1_013994 [Brachionus plicatilis]|uniref:Uncharacterized protein n=1 Tax=Brachionus plicatilis TaxID=10195 RepID=A0A3M7SSQ5_BRAPC|nr:hypothetical protein BpHYR1_013994 [Brachionus plicatilis]